MIRFSKSFLMNPAKLWISGIRCSCDNIMKIADIFMRGQVVVTIDSVTEESALLIMIMDQGLQYAVKQHTDVDVEISVVVPYDLCKDILEQAISEEPENIFVFHLLDPIIWDAYLQGSVEALVAAGKTDAFLSVSLDENAALITVNKFLLPPKEVYRKLKALRFE